MSSFAPLFRIVTALAMLAGVSSVLAGGWSRAYLDDLGNVRVVSAAGRDTELASSSKVLRPTVAADGQTVAWLMGGRKDIDQGVQSGSSDLVVYRDGRRRRIHCEPFIRDFWFWKSGAFVVVDCGGAHFAGQEILYDTRSGKSHGAIDTATVPPEQRPLWSNSNPDFRADGK